MDTVGLELDRQLQSLADRSSAMNARAGTLLAAGGIAGGLLGTQTPGPLAAAAVGLLVLTILLSMGALHPALGDGVPIERFEDVAWDDHPAVARRRLNRWKQLDLTAGERWLMRRRRLLLIGAGTLALALALVSIDLAT